MIGILLIGYCRLDFLTNNISRILPLCKDELHLYIAVDGEKVNQSERAISTKDLEIILGESLRSPNIHVLFRNSNFGCDSHIPRSIEWALETSQGVVVIEDDVRISPSSLKALIERLKINVEKDIRDPIVGMSGLTKIPFFGRNYWRKSLYFSAWGFAITRSFWSLHRERQKTFDSRFREQLSQWQLNRLLEISKSWKKLSSRKKRIWLERFNRGNYDYQIQLTVMFYDLCTFAPLFRVIENVGHGLKSASHTKHKAPLFMRFKLGDFGNSYGEMSKRGSFLRKLFIFIDSNSWAGDGIMSKRGRTFGLRSGLRFIFRNV